MNKRRTCHSCSTPFELHLGRSGGFLWDTACLHASPVQKHSGPRCFEQHKSNKAMEATKSHVQARKHKCDDQLIIECWFHKFRIEGSWNQSNYEFEMLVWRCTNLPTAEAKPEYVNAKAVQATGFKGMPKVLSSTKPNPKSSLADTFIACQYSLADCRGQGHITATGLAADGMQIQMIKQFAVVYMAHF